MRPVVILIASVLSSGCVAPRLGSTTSALSNESGSPDSVPVCELSDQPCSGGGKADGIVAVAVGTAIGGLLAFVLARRFAPPTLRAPDTTDHGWPIAPALPEARAKLPATSAPAAPAASAAVAPSSRP